MNVAEKEITIAQNVPKVFNAGYEKGKAEVVDYIPYLSTFTFSSAISEITEDIYLDCSELTSTHNWCSGCTFGCNKLTLKFTEKCISLRGLLNNTFGTLEEVEILGNTSKVTNWYFAFANTVAKRIIGELDFTSATNVGDIFRSTRGITEIRIKPLTLHISMSVATLAELSTESIQSIVGGLADLTGQESQTITFHTDVKTKLTDGQISTITNKNWTLA